MVGFTESPHMPPFQLCLLPMLNTCSLYRPQVQLYVRYDLCLSKRIVILLRTEINITKFPFKHSYAQVGIQDIYLLVHLYLVSNHCISLRFTVYGTLRPRPRRYRRNESGWGTLICTRMHQGNGKTNTCIDRIRMTVPEPYRPIACG